MTASVWTGPLAAIGPMGGSPGTSRDYTYESGPSFFYMGQGVPDQRFVPITKDNMTPGSVRAHLDNATFTAVNVIPAALAAANIVAAATGTSGTAMTLAAASAGITTGVPFINSSGAVVTANMALDFGFDSLNVTSGSKTATPAGSVENYRVGQPLVVANVGNSGATTALLTYVTAVGATTITLADAAAATNTAARVGTGNNIMRDTAFVRAPTGASMAYTKGATAFLDATQSLCRGVRVVSNSASDTGWTMVIVGYDIYGQPQTETITVAANSTAWGQKTWKYITSATPVNTGSSVGTFSVGTSDMFGFAYRNVLWEYLSIFWSGASLAASTGWVAGDLTIPNATTGKDPRGTIQIGTNGPSGSGATGGASNGTNKRLTIFQTIALQDMVNQSDQAGTFYTLYGQPPG